MMDYQRRYAWSCSCCWWEFTKLHRFKMSPHV